MSMYKCLSCKIAIQMRLEPWVGEYQMYGNGKIAGGYNCFWYLKVLINTGPNIVCIELAAGSF